MSLCNCVEGVEYTIKDVLVDDELKAFLLTLGCYVGEKVTVISIQNTSIVISLNGTRYNIDNQLAELILV